MPRPDFIQAPSYWQVSAVYKLVCLNRNLVAGRYGDCLPADIAVEFRAAMGLCNRLFELPFGNDNISPEDADRTVAKIAEEISQ